MNNRMRGNILPEEKYNVFSKSSNTSHSVNKKPKIFPSRNNSPDPFDRKPEFFFSDITYYPLRLREVCRRADKDCNDPTSISREIESILREGKNFIPLKQKELAIQFLGKIGRPASTEFIGQILFTQKTPKINDEKKEKNIMQPYHLRQSTTTSFFSDSSSSSSRIILPSSILPLLIVG